MPKGVIVHRLRTTALYCAPGEPGLQTETPPPKKKNYDFQIFSLKNLKMNSQDLLSQSIHLGGGSIVTTFPIHQILLFICLSFEAILMQLRLALN